MKWGQLAAPIYAADNVTIQRAQSLLTGKLVGGVCPPLTVEEAAAVMAWHEATKGEDK